MKNNDQRLDLAQGGDTGTDDADSVQPIANTERVWPTLTNRPTENLRRRTERIRRAVEDLLFLADYDRELVIWSNGAFEFTEVSPGRYVLRLVGGDTLYVVPALTPGRQSGGRHQGGRVFCANSAAGDAWTPYSGTPGVDDLVLVADRRYTAQRGYADADSYEASPGGRSLGANRIEVALVADSGVVGGLGTIVAEVTGNPKTKIRIVYGTAGTPTTLANLITFINNDRSSQGGYGVADYLRASTTGSASNTPTPFSAGLVQGAYDAETHRVMTADFDAFFAETENQLREGEGLAVGYPVGLVERSATPDGGRRQSIWDLPTDRVGNNTDNTMPAIGVSLFSTGREPEKIPGSIPIGKVVEGEFVFIDGTRLAPGETLSLGESRVLYARLAETAPGSDGASLVGYEGSGSWHADAAATTGPSLPASTVTAALTRIVAHLANAATNQSGARRVGVEGLSPTATVGNEALAVTLPSGSLRQALNTILNGLDGASRLIGLNGRVSELGHRMVGGDPLYKDFGAAGMPSGGAVFTQATLRAAPNLAAAEDGVRDFAHMVLQPLVFDDGSGASVGVDEPATVEDFTVIGFPTMDPTRFTKLVNYLPIVTPAVGVSVPLVLVHLTGLSNNGDGLYYVRSHNTAARQMTLRALDGTDPMLSASGAIAATFYTGFVLGSDQRHARLNFFHMAGATGNRAPLMNIGVGYPTQPILDIYRPNANTGERLLRLSASQLEVASLRRVAGGVITRDSENILGSGDKVLLDGVESGAPVDASLSHHHDGRYALVGHDHGATYTRTLIHTEERDVTNGVTVLNPLALNHAKVTAWTLWELGVAAPIGYTVVGRILRYTVRVTTDGTSGAWTSAAAELQFRTPGNTDPGFTYTFAGPNGGVGLAATHTFSGTVVVPTNASGQISARVVTSGAIDATVSTLALVEVGQVLQLT